MSTQNFNEAPIKIVVEQILVTTGKEALKHNIMREIIRLQRSTVEAAEVFFKTMVRLGLDNCTKGPRCYCIDEFAIMRHYFTKDEIFNLTSIQNRIRKRRR